MHLNSPPVDSHRHPHSRKAAAAAGKVTYNSVRWRRGRLTPQAGSMSAGLVCAGQAEGLVQQQEEAEAALSEGEEAAVPPMATTASRMHRVSAEPNLCVTS